MHPHRRRKKRNNYGIRTVEIERGLNGFGFTISGQQPCILSCIVSNSPADQAGLRAGDFLISVNGLSVSKSTHDNVVKLIGQSVGPIRMSIAEYYYSDSSDDEFDSSRVSHLRKPKYTHRPRLNRNGLESSSNFREISPKKSPNPKKVDINPNSIRHLEKHIHINKVQNINNTANSIEFKCLVGYLGTIEIPKQLLPNSKLQTVCSCIRKLRQEKRNPSSVLMTVLPDCLTLKNVSNQILAIYPSNRLIFISSSSEKDSRYFGIITTALTCDVDPFSACPPFAPRYASWEGKEPPPTEIELSNSCHVFITDPKLVDHKKHQNEAESFNLTCTPDIIGGNCLEFPKNALYIVNFVQNMYQLQSETAPEHKNFLDDALVANSPQPSASSNSDSGIGFRDDCGNISDRILVVEFPALNGNMAPVLVQNNRPSAIDGSVSNVDLHQLFNSPLGKENEPSKESRLTVRAMPDPKIFPAKEFEIRNGDVDSGQVFTEKPVDVPNYHYYENDPDFTVKSSQDNISMNSFQSVKNFNNFKAPNAKPNLKKQKQNKRPLKQSSFENLNKNDSVVKSNFDSYDQIFENSEKFNNFDKFGSLQNLNSWSFQQDIRKNSAISEPDVRIERKTSNLELNRGSG